MANADEEALAAQIATEQSLDRDIRSIIISAGETGIPRSSIQGELSYFGRSIRKHPNPSGVVNTVIERLIESGDFIEINDAGQNILRWKGVSADEKAANR
ncbi:MAG: hypothetical protein WB952_05735 [Terriglobales bacterium]